MGRWWAIVSIFCSALASGRPPPISSAAPRSASYSRDRETAWVVEVWIDRGWYDLQDSDQPCPAPVAPVVVPVHGSSLVVGRTSDRLGVRPEVEAGHDVGVSRRHAQLTTDGRRFWVRDLGTPNGTFVGTVGEPLPREPIGRDVPVEVGRDDRIYVGTWTRLVLRPAADRERAARAGQDNDSA